MPEPPAANPNTTNTRTAPAIDVASGRPITRWNRDSVRMRSSPSRTGRAPDARIAARGGPAGGTSLGLSTRGSMATTSAIRSSVLRGELLDLADVVLGHDPGAGADVARAVHWG